MADLEELLSRLVRHDVRFVVVGGFAAVAHGISLLTQDIDVCCDFSPDNLLKLQAALADLHPVHRMTPKRLPLGLTREKCAGLKNLYLDTDYGQLDCISEVKGVGGYADVEKKIITVDLEAGPCRILSLDALIEAKQAMDRPRDREALIELQAIRSRQKQSPP